MNRPSGRWALALPLLVLTVALAAAGLGCKKEVPPPPPPPPTPTPQPPAGNVVFIQGGHLLKIALKGMEIVPLTSGKSTEWFPAVSPLGDEVLYWSNAASGQEEEGVYNLWKIRIDGTGRTQLTSNETNAINHASQNLLMNNAPAWSSDAKKIVYSLDGDIWMMGPDGFNPETVLLGYGAFCPSFSPDGKTVLFVSRKGDPVFNLWTVNLNDRTVKKLTNYTDWNVGSPSFSPNGQKILYNLYKESVTQVYVCSADGSSPLNLTSDNKSLMPRWAENGHKVVYCSAQGDGPGLSVFIMNENGTDPKPVTGSQATSPSWGPQYLTIPLPTPITK